MQKLCKAKKILLIGLSVFAVSLCGMDVETFANVGQENKQDLDPYNSFLPTIVDNEQMFVNINQEGLEEVVEHKKKEEKRKSGSRPGSRSASPQRFVERVENFISDHTDQFLHPTSGHVDHSKDASQLTDHSKIHEKVEKHKKRLSQKKAKIEKIANQVIHTVEHAVHLDSNIGSGLELDAFQVLPISPEVKEQVDEAMGVISHLDKALERNAGHKSKTNANDLLQQAEALKHTSDPEQKHIVEHPVKKQEEHKVNATSGTQQPITLIVKPTREVLIADNDERDPSDPWHIAENDPFVLCNVTDQDGKLWRTVVRVPLSVFQWHTKRDVEMNKTNYSYIPEIDNEELKLLMQDGIKLVWQKSGTNDQGHPCLVPNIKTMHKAVQASDARWWPYQAGEIVVVCSVGKSGIVTVPVDVLLQSEVIEFENDKKFIPCPTRLQRDDLEKKKEELEKEHNATIDEKSKKTGGDKSKTTQPLIQPGAKIDTNQSKQSRWSVLYSKPVVFGAVVVGVLGCFSWLYANNRLSESLQSHCESFLNVFRTFYNAF